MSEVDQILLEFSSTNYIGVGTQTVAHALYERGETIYDGSTEEISRPVECVVKDKYQTQCFIRMSKSAVP